MNIGRNGLSKPGNQQTTNREWLMACDEERMND
jgi:hypothetical protein